MVKKKIHIEISQEFEQADFTRTKMNLVLRKILNDIKYNNDKNSGSFQRVRIFDSAHKN